MGLPRRELWRLVTVKLFLSLPRRRPAQELAASTSRRRVVPAIARQAADGACSVPVRRSMTSTLAPADSS